MYTGGTEVLKRILYNPRYYSSVLFYLITYGDFLFGDLTLGEFFCINIFQEKSHSYAVAVCSWHFFWILSWPKFFDYNARIVKFIFYTQRHLFLDFHRFLSFVNLFNDNGEISHRHAGNCNLYFTLKISVIRLEFIISFS